MKPKAGTVTLVGAGPGDPGLITVRGLAALRRADVVIYDRLVSSELLRFARADAERIYAGKKPRAHTMTQQEMNATLIARAREGCDVVRLKGGDPFVFGRGGEEAEALAAAGIRFEVIPGVSSAIAGPAVAGIPVTHREVARSVAIVTAHRSPKGAQLDWSALARIDTVVLLMGVAGLGVSARALIAAGRSPLTPAAVVENATLASQRTVTAPLAKIAAVARATRIKSPAITVVGDVAAMREILGGWDTRAALGVRCLVTRSSEQASALSEALRALGAEPVESPTIRIEAVKSFARLDAMIARVRSYEWLVFTSSNGVRSFFARLAALDLDARALGGVRVAVVGNGTAEVLATYGVRAALQPPSFTARAIGRAFPRGRGRVLLVGAKVVGPELAEALTAKGWACESVAVYQVRPIGRLEPSARRALLGGEIDVVTFASGSAVRAFARALGTGLPAGVRVACIGPVSAQAARDVGMRVDVVARVHTMAGLAQAAIKAAR